MRKIVLVVLLAVVNLSLAANNQLNTLELRGCLLTCEKLKTGDPLKEGCRKGCEFHDPIHPEEDDIVWAQSCKQDCEKTFIAKSEKDQLVGCKRSCEYTKDPMSDVDDDDESDSYEDSLEDDDDQFFVSQKAPVVADVVGASNNDEANKTSDVSMNVEKSPELARKEFNGLFGKDLLSVKPNTKTVMVELRMNRGPDGKLQWNAERFINGKQETSLAGSGKSDEIMEGVMDNMNDKLGFLSTINKDVSEQFNNMFARARQMMNAGHMLEDSVEDDSKDSDEKSEEQLGLPRRFMTMGHDDMSRIGPRVGNIASDGSEIIHTETLSNANWQTEKMGYSRLTTILITASLVIVCMLSCLFMACVVNRCRKARYHTVGQVDVEKQTAVKQHEEYAYQKPSGPPPPCYDQLSIKKEPISE